MEEEHKRTMAQQIHCLSRIPPEYRKRFHLFEIPITNRSKELSNGMKDGEEIFLRATVIAKWRGQLTIGYI